MTPSTDHDKHTTGDGSVVGIVLAAGEGRRFGRPKANRIPAGTTIRIAASARSAEITTKVMPMRGHQYPESPLPAPSIGLPNWSTGWHTSPKHSTPPPKLLTPRSSLSVDEMPPKPPGSVVDTTSSIAIPGLR